MNLNGSQCPVNGRRWRHQRLLPELKQILSDVAEDAGNGGRLDIWRFQGAAGRPCSFQGLKVPDAELLGTLPVSVPGLLLSAPGLTVHGGACQVAERGR